MEGIMFDFTNKVTLVTGAAGNLGQTLAQAFHEAGATVAASDFSADRLTELFTDLPGILLLPGVDVTKETAVNTMIERVIQEYGRIDILCNVAGGFKKGPTVAETAVETWDFQLNLNAKSVFLVSKATIPHMLSQGSGKIVNVAARAALAGSAQMAPYIVSKTAVIRLTESIAAELKNDNINVNCILPGTIDTPQNREAMPNADYDKWVPTEDLVNVMLFLASDLAQAINGAAIPVYGRS
jgi:NAD(P)-dependent dehydrogenase (short-subunit alcohol dehydrogenase family)